jgi:tRNA threonylcarbamoyladenosine biosynthesis protein TsaE
VLEQRLTTAGRDAMVALGSRLAGLLRAGDVVVLNGELGAGKTTMTQGIGAGLGVRGPITSPTFVIARVHPSLTEGPQLVHVDAYRLGSIAEVDDLDLDATLESAVTVVEWGEGMVDELSSDRLEIWIGRPRGARLAGPDGDPDPDELSADEPRTVLMRGVGSRWSDVRWPADELSPAP